ncbi:MAG: SoxR reducing system RseC family protein [Mangrovibacterium sp.]
MSGEIVHEGIIKRITDDTIWIGIVNQSACAGCHAKGACTAADMKDKEVEVRRNSTDYRIGQRVSVVGKTTQGFLALFYAYLFPFIVLMAVLILCTNLNFGEGVSALLALASLVPYYFVLYLCKDKLKNKLEFEIKPI